ncbi:CBM96 family carbohydrate-binding protein [Subtercola lobariae]|uniref:F5/8 type C domain-containing protein n=1 Tax=Subtercola lobariae TaxID=1588641 RepID=A0A917AZS2_9MICO|nr:DNRLRE domain-containing protein [Subtercola lobariae]GGF12821.1 hypothetical protein GCM10011399_03430 [Subtercola lobariae]
MIALAAVLGAVLTPFQPLPSAAAATVATAATPTDIIADVSTAHPRLLLTSASLADLKVAVITDATAMSWYSTIQASADAIIPLAVTTYDTSSGDLLSASRQILMRTYTLGLMWQITGNTKYADRLWAELNAAASFPDWNPSHFLDTAEMAHAFGIGYDWLYSYLSATQRSTLTAAVESKAFTPALTTYAAQNYWSTDTSNWNVVSNSGLSIAALAFAQDSSSMSGQILDDARASIVNGLAEYSPDGGYTEGITYWSYASNYLTTYISSLESSTGNDYGLLATPGLSQTGLFALNLSGPSGNFANFGDAWVNEPMTTPLLGLESLYGDSTLRTRAIAATTGPDAVDPTPKALIWYAAVRATPVPTVPALPLDTTFAEYGVSTLRSSWAQRQATFVALKTATDTAPGHSDLDGGSFTLDALGQQWAVDLGADSYSLPGYFDVTNGGRWNIYKKRAEGQNRIVLNPGTTTSGPDSDPSASSTVQIVRADATTASAVTDLTSSYPSALNSWKRGVSLFDNRTQVLVQDELSGKSNLDTWWYMHTAADINIAPDGKSAVLSQNGQQLLARIASPSTATFSMMAAAPLWTSPQVDGQSTNAGINKLSIRISGTSTVKLAVQFTPITGAATPALATVTPLANWGTAATQYSALTSLALDGKPLSTFTPGTLAYQVQASSVSTPPTVSGASTSGATVAITQASATPGQAKIVVTEPGKSPVTYTVSFMPGAVPWVSLTASVDTASNPVSAVVDNSLYTNWSVTGEQWIAFDLGRPQTVQHAEIYWGDVGVTGAKYAISVSNDNINWTAVYNGTAKQSADDQYASFTTGPIVRRYVRILVYGDPTNKKTIIRDVKFMSEDKPTPVSPTTGHYSATLSAGATQFNLGDKTTLTYSLLDPSGATVPGSTLPMSFTSSNSAIASINSSGVMTALKPGIVTVGVKVWVANQWVWAVRGVTIKDPLDVVIMSNQDSYVQGGNWTASNFKTAVKLLVSHSTPYPQFDRTTLMGFDLSSLAGKQIESASVVFGANVTDSSGATASHLDALAVSSPWSESTVTYNTKPTTGDRVGYVAVDENLVPRTMDVTDYVRAKVGGSADLAFSQDDGGVGQGLVVSIDSRRSADKPYLQIRLRSGSPLAAPTLTTAVSTSPSAPGVITGTVAGPASTKMTVDLAAATAATCPVARASGRSLGVVSVTTNGSGTASFTVNGALTMGDWVYGVVSDAEPKSSNMSSCMQVTAAPGVGQKLTLMSSQDGYVQGGTSSDSNFKTAVALLSSHTTAYPQYDRETFMDFDLSSLANKSIESAQMYFMATNTSTTTTNTHLTAFAVTSPWSESTVTFNTKPTTGDRIGTVPVDKTASLRSMDITDYVRQMKGAVGSLAFSQDDSGVGTGSVVSIDGRRSMNKPYIVVTLRAYATLAVPAISSALSNTSSGPGAVTGTVTGPASTAMSVDLYSTSASTCPISRYSGTSLGAVSVTTNSAGQASFIVNGNLNIGDKVFGTVTAVGPRSSELSGCTTVVAAPGVSVQLSLPTTQDAYVQGGDWAASNFKTAVTLFDRHSAAYPSFDRYTYMGLDLSSLSGKNIQSAKLMFYASVTDSGGTSSHIRANSVTSAWSESTVTFNTKPTMGASVGYTTVDSSSSLRSLDITSYVKANQGGSASVAFTQDDAGVGTSLVVSITSKRTLTVANRPYLLVTLVPAS